MRLIVLVLLLVPGIAQAADPIVGKWRTQDGKAIVALARCGAGMCGQVVKVLAPKAPRLDENNADAKLRHRPILGLEVLIDFRQDGDTWKGRIYSPEEGKTYRSTLRRNQDGSLKVKGRVAIFCKTQIWTRVG